MEDYKWKTDHAHNDNTETMTDFLENHLPHFDGNFVVLMDDGTYAEIMNDTGEVFEVHASGDGDSTHHKVEFVNMPEQEQ